MHKTTYTERKGLRKHKEKDHCKLRNVWNKYNLIKPDFRALLSKHIFGRGEYQEAFNWTIRWLQVISTIIAIITILLFCLLVPFPPNSLVARNEEGSCGSARCSTTDDTATPHSPHCSSYIFTLQTIHYEFKIMFWILVSAPQLITHVCRWFSFFWFLSNSSITRVEVDENGDDGELVMIFCCTIISLPNSKQI